MSYFSTEKRLQIAVLGIHASGTDSVGLSWADLQLFSTETQVQIASSIKYPVVTTNSITIDLESGWKYLIELKIKVSDTTPSGSENIQYRLLDNSSNVISSVGSCAIYRDTAVVYSQEKCIAYIDASAGAYTFKAQAISTSGSKSINSSADAGNTNFRSHFLIKAWK